MFVAQFLENNLKIPEFRVVGLGFGFLKSVVGPQATVSAAAK